MPGERSDQKRDPPTRVTVEFFGVPRRRAGLAEVEVEANTIGAVLEQLSLWFPQLVPDCLDDGRLRTGYIVNVNGERFTQDPTTPLVSGDRVLLLSADVGG